MNPLSPFFDHPLLSPIPFPPTPPTPHCYLHPPLVFSTTVLVSKYDI